MNELLQSIRTESRNLSLRELLGKPPRVLLGVTPGAEAVLAELDVKTVFDLATSAAFEAATKLVSAGSDHKSALYQHGSATADLVRESKVAGKKVDELQFCPIVALDAIPPSKAATIETELDVQTVRDLSLYPPYRAAARILNVVYFPENAPGFDPERPGDLLPKTGEYPTERVQYTTLLLDAIERQGGNGVVDVTDAGFKPLDLAALEAGDAGFKQVAFGALLTLSQSWFAQGVTLGQLLHSTSLAPGESTRVAVIDWSRRSSAGETETIAETDQLSSDSSHNRSISEVTKAVATEAQTGFSETSSFGVSTQEGSAWAAEASAPLGGLLGGLSGSTGGSSARATTSTHAEGYSTSYGRRDVGSSMMQNVNDRTHQHAHSARSRRASVVKEVAQTEHEGVSTRVIANYNHMHALTVQYYEVVQVYRVEVATVKADRVVFIPLELVDFDKDAMVRRFQGVLERSALTDGLRDALRNLDVLEVAPEPQTHFPVLGNKLNVFLRDALVGRSALAAAMRFPTAPPPPPPADSPAAQLSKNLPVAPQVNDRLWTREQTARLSGLLNRAVLRPDSNAVCLPTDVSVEGGAASAGGTSLKIVFHTQAGASVEDVGPQKPLAMSEVTWIGLTGSSPDRDLSATVTLTLNRNGVRFPLELPAVTVPKANAGEVRVVNVKAGGVNTNVKKHLKDNRLYYSQAVFRSLDSAQIALLLAGYGVKVGDTVVPVAQVVEPVPIRYVGNYLAFKMNTDVARDEEWAKWLKERGIQLGATQQDIVPLPSGGTFAEAILGRSNCAEKLDITRFWNWQDSPIPLQPTEISAIQTGSRATPEDTSPGQLSSPIINITSPTSLPDPAGTAAVLAAIQNGAMFRDMSGLQGAMGLAQAALQATSAGAASAGQQAGTNMNSLLQANTERQRIAAEMITSLAKTAAAAYTGMPVGGGGGISGGGAHSQDGAKINYFDKTRDQSPSGSASGAGGGAGTVVAGGGGRSSNGGGPSGNGGGATGSRSGAVVDAGGNGYSDNPAALDSLWGDTQSPSGLVDSLLDKAGTALGLGGNPSGAIASTATRQAWPHLDANRVLPRIAHLEANPNDFQQGSAPLCAAAAFFHHMIQRYPNRFASFARTLFGAGYGYLGGMKINPDSDLRNADYSAIAAAFPNTPPQADWMLISALRDDANWFLDYEGSPSEEDAVATWADELDDWYSETGFYTAVTYVDDMDVPKIKAIHKTANNHIVLLVNATLIGGSDGGHAITLEGPMTINEANDTASFDYWTWGLGVQTVNTSLTTLKEKLTGVVTATF